jgi:predicted O-methyltransferase YrrM
MAEGGLMVFDNTLWSGRVLNEEDLKSDADTRNMHAFNQYLAATEEAEVLMLPIRDGLTLLRKRNP